MLLISGDTLDQLLDEVIKFGNSYEQSRQDMAKIATYFEKETANSEKGSRLTQEIQKLPDLSLSDKFKATDLIARYPHKIDIFFGLSEELRREYVVTLLYEEMGYRPTFDFNLGDD